MNHAYNPNSLAARIVADPAASFALKNTLKVYMDRDPVDALNDAEALTAALRDNLQLMTGSGDKNGVLMPIRYNSGRHFTPVQAASALEVK